MLPNGDVGRSWYSFISSFAPHDVCQHPSHRRDCRAVAKVSEANGQEQALSTPSHSLFCMFWVPFVLSLDCSPAMYSVLSLLEAKRRVPVRVVKIGGHFIHEPALEVAFESKSICSPKVAFDRLEYFHRGHVT